MRFLGQLVLESEAVETTGQLKVEQDVSLYYFIFSLS